MHAANWFARKSIQAPQPLQRVTHYVTQSEALHVVNNKMMYLYSILIFVSVILILI